MYASSPSNCLYIPRFGSTKDKKCKDACEKYIAAQDFECTATGKTRAANSAQMKAYASIPKFDNMVSAPHGRHYGPVTDVNTVEEFIMGGDANSRQQQSGSRQQQSGSSGNSGGGGFVPSERSCRAKFECERTATT